MPNKLLSSLGVACATLLFPTLAHAGFGTNGTTCNQPSLAAAVAALPAGGTIHVSGNNNVTATTVIGSNITLAGASAGCVSSNTATASITRTNAGVVMDVSNSDSLVTMRVSLHGSGGGSTVDVGNNAAFWAVKAEIDGGSAVQGGCIHADNGATVLLDDAIVEDCTATNGGGVFIHTDAQLLAYEGTIIRDNDASACGGGVAVEGGTASISGEVSMNTASQGGGICVRNDYEVGATGSTLTLSSDGQVVENIADVAGGGIFVDRTNTQVPASSVIVQDSADVGWNDSSGTGGGIHAEGADVIISLLETAGVRSNTASGRGGGVYLYKADLQVSGEAFVTSNESGSDGGGIHADTLASVLVEDEGKVTSNTAEGDGGGISAREYSRVDVLDWAWILQNTAGGDGGGIAMTYSPGSVVAAAPLILQEMAFSSNTASGSGGGISLQSGALGFEITSVDMSGNDALFGDGGAILVDDSDVVIANCSFENNTANRGGAITARGASIVEVNGVCDDACSNDCSILEHNTASGVNGLGGALYSGGGSTLTASGIVLRDNSASSDGSAVYLTGATSAMVLRNVLVDSHVDDDVTAIEANDGDLDLRQSTLVENFQAVHYAAASTGAFHRNVTADNATPNDFDFALTGNCNVAPTAAENPSGGSNAVGSPSFGACWMPAAGETLIINACGSGQTTDLLGVARPQGPAFDRGAFERT